MRHTLLKYLIAPLIFFVLALNVGNGQNCYELLEDPSGYNSGALNPTIEAAACELKDTFPIEFRNNFKVFDAGFYIETQAFGDGQYSSRFEELKNVAASESPYYLLVARKSTPNGLNSAVFVDFVLPTDGIFSCSEPGDLSILQIELKSKFKDLSNESAFISGFLDAINHLKDEVSGMKVCCDINPLFRSEKICGKCNVNDAAFAKFLKDEYFTGEEVNVIESPFSNSFDEITINSYLSTDDTDYTLLELSDICVYSPQADPLNGANIDPPNGAS